MIISIVSKKAPFSNIILAPLIARTIAEGNHDCKMLGLSATADKIIELVYQVSRDQASSVHTLTRILAQPTLRLLIIGCNNEEIALANTYSVSNTYTPIIVAYTKPLDEPNMRRAIHAPRWLKENHILTTEYLKTILAKGRSLEEATEKLYARLKGEERIVATIGARRDKEVFTLDVNLISNKEAKLYHDGSTLILSTNKAMKWPIELKRRIDKLKAIATLKYIKIIKIKEYTKKETDAQ
ncbi:MAG: hypothetical protein ABWW69_03535 [Pyrodictiaceae archaeon]